MQIFIVYYINFNSEHVFQSAHSSEEKARELIDRYAVSDRSSFYIEPYTLDEEN